jgi:hypothetical protein
VTVAPPRVELARARKIAVVLHRRRTRAACRHRIALKSLDDTVYGDCHNVRKIIAGRTVMLNTVLIGLSVLLHFHNHSGRRATFVVVGTCLTL